MSADKVSKIINTFEFGTKFKTRRDAFLLIIQNITYFVSMYNIY